MGYRYVNLGFSDKTGNGRFRRDYTVPLEDVDKLRHLAGNECFYRTVWRYPSKDYEKHAENGEALAPFYLDIDNKDTEKAREETLELVDYFLETVPERHLYLYFSGNKGFHLEIPPEVFNLEEKLPDTKAAYAYKNYAKRLKEEHAPDIDLAVYEPKRLWRVVNSKNEKSGLYKVPVTISEMEVLSGEEIKELAERQRRNIYSRRQKARPIPEMEEIYNYYRELDPSDSIVRGNRNSNARARVSEPIIDEETPCIEGLLGGAKEGERNETAIRLASAYRNFGHSEQGAVRELELWNNRNRPPMPDYEIRNTVHSAYRNNYNYGCRDYLLERHCDKDECPVVKKKRD